MNKIKVIYELIKIKFSIRGFVGWMENLTMKNLRIHLHFLILFARAKGFQELIPGISKSVK